MADIVQLKENGVLKYLMTHAKAVDGLSGEISKSLNTVQVYRNINYRPGISRYSEFRIPCIYKIGRLCIAVGAVRNAQPIVAGATVELFQVPKGLEPELDFYDINQGTNFNRWFSYITRAGVFTMARYAAGGKTVALNAGTFLPFTQVWITK